LYRSGGRFRSGAAAATLISLIFRAALGLREQRRQNAGERNHQRDQEEHQAHRAPQGRVARGAGLLRNVGEGHAARDGREDVSEAARM